jgi:acetyltransferase-like isoleucine patch superfamily enzyme
MKKFLVVVIASFPHSRLKLSLLRVLGWEISKGAYFGSNFVYGLDHCSLGENTSIGNLNVFRNVKKLNLKQDALIGNLNWFSAEKTLEYASNLSFGEVHLSEGASITNRHYFDISGSLSLGTFSTIAGIRSTFLTHSIDLKENKQVCRQILVGKYCFLGGDSKFLPGVSIPDYVVIGIGSVVLTKTKIDSLTLVAGNPAGVKKTLDMGYSYFTRPEAKVH